MPTANSTSAKPSKPRAKAKRKVARKTTARASAARKTTARKTTARKTTARKTTARKTARKPAAKAASRRTSSRATRAKAAKGGRTRAIHQPAFGQTPTASRETAGAFGDYAERAVLIPVGAALLARDRVVSSVSDTLNTYSSSTKAQAQLRRFERRGVTARNRLEREVRKARVRVERELRQRRRVVENRVNDLDDRREALTRNGSELANRVPEIAREVQERILSLV
jgi:hypothetical protein